MRAVGTWYSTGTLKDREAGVLLRHFLIVAWLLTATVPAIAEDPRKTLENFYDTCLANGPSFDRTKAEAVLFKWKPLPPEALAMLAPQQAPDRFEGWVVASKGTENTIVAVTEGPLDGRPVVTCTMAAVGVNGKDVEKLFLERLAPRKTGEQSNGMQEIRFCRLTTGVQLAEQLVIVSMVAPVNDKPVVMMSSMIDAPKGRRAD
ncbi:MAG: hypothetical protein WAV72_11750 [Bradyrhizobium sp.]